MAKKKKALEAKTDQPTTVDPIVDNKEVKVEPVEIKAVVEPVIDPEYVPECEGASVGACDLEDPVCLNCQAEPHPDFAYCNAKKDAKATTGKGTKKKTGSTGVKRGKGSVVKQFAKDKIGEGKYTRKQIIESFLLQYPQMSETTIGTVLSDSKNSNYYQNKKYGYDFPHLVIQDPVTKVLRYKEDEVPAVVTA